MKKIRLLGSAIVIGFLLLSPVKLFAQDVDYYNYEEAKRYCQMNNFVLAYKNLIIFKYLNLKRLMQQQNTSVFKEVNSKISELEGVLTQNYEMFTLKRGRGFSDKAIDSVLAALRRQIKFKPIQLK